MGTNGMRPAVVPGQYIIGFKPGTTGEQRAAAVRSLAPKTTEDLPLIDGMLVIDPDRSLNGKSLGPALDGVVEFVQPNYRLSLRQPAAAAKAVAAGPDDPNFKDQYHHDNQGQTGGTKGADVKTPAAWPTSKGKGAVVAIVDTNVDITHPDLKDNVWVNAGEVAGNGKDDDGNGYVDDVNGWNFGRNSNRPQDGGDSHGTHVAGIIGAVANNKQGGTGVAPDVTLMPLPILTGGATTANAVKAFDYAVRNGANVISNSWGNNTYEPALAAAVAKATQAGSLVVVAAGNENWDTGIHGSYPDNYAGSVSIGASDHRDGKASYSNRGRITIDVAAPGDAILSTMPNNRYGKMSGTSMAAPVYSGVAALVKSAYPQLTMKQVEQRIFRSVQKDGSAAPWNPLVASGGRVDAAAALLPIATPSAPGPATQSQPAAGQAVRLGWNSDIKDGQSFEVQASLNAGATSQVADSFEGDAPARAFTSFGDAKWEIAEGAAKEGTKSFQVTGLRSDRQAGVELTETLPEATELSFWYKGAKSGELSFFVDRDLQFKPTASEEWQQFKATLPAGEHTLSWLAAGRGGTSGTFAIDGLSIGKVSDAKWAPVGNTQDTKIEWTPDKASPDAAVRVRPNNGRWSGDWVQGTPFAISDAQ